MKLLFSEHKSDYSNYIFPYAIWAIPENNETPSMIFNRGFLPGTRDMKRFYMCRHVRVRLAEFSPSSENRRILRKCEDIEYRCVAKADFNYTKAWREFCKNYADIKFGKDIMTTDRLDSLFQSDMITHLLIFTDTETGKEIGIVTLYVEGDELGFFYYSFYDLNYYNRNLGMFIMTSAVDFFSKSSQKFLYLGTCYSKNALYKTQFTGAEFFNGFHWSKNIKELKFLINRDQRTVTQHLIESEEYQELFHLGELEVIVKEGDYEFYL